VSLAVSRAAVTIQNIRSVHVKDIAATVENGVVALWRVKIDLAFAIQDRLHE